MNSSLRTSLLGAVAVVLVMAPAIALADEPAGIDGEPWFPVPFRIRDLTFPTVLVMGFMPRPAEALEDGDWAIELNYSVSNNFQVSGDVERYLEQRGGPRRPLSQSDVDAMLATLEGEQFLIDGELGLFDLGLHYAVTERVMASLRISYLRPGGALLDGFIFDFHDSFGFDQVGRQYLADHQTQIFLMDGESSFVRLTETGGGGFIDPVLSLTYVFPRPWRGWGFALEAGLKVPLADEAELLSTGGFDFGLQLTAQKKWRKNALVINLAEVVPGDFGQAAPFDPPDLPSVNVAFLHRMKRRTTGILQLLFSENIFREVNDTDLAELEFQLAAGVKIEAWGGVIGLGLTENLLNYDNTPDFALHASYAVVLD